MSRTVYARVFFSRSWSTIQHWLPEIGEFSVHAIGLLTIEAQFEVLFFQFVCGLALSPYCNLCAKPCGQLGAFCDFSEARHKMLE